ncbi:(ribosomal protein S5)-alanine N-acetyltransferase [Azospirillaceae bacterium]
MIRFLSNGLLGQPSSQLENGRVVVRPPTLKDWPAWSCLRDQSRSFLTPWEPTWPPDALSRETFIRRLRRQAQEWRNDNGYSYLIFDAKHNVLVGGLSLGNIRRGVAQTGTIGYWIGQQFTRQGFANAAVCLVLEHAFMTLGLHRIEASCLPSNNASRNLLQKVGFALEGCARGYLRIDGSWRDHMLFAILKEDWVGSSEHKHAPISNNHPNPTEFLYPIQTSNGKNGVVV